jgi:hypothetical protein
VPTTPGQRRPHSAAASNFPAGHPASQAAEQLAIEYAKDPRVLGRMRLQEIVLAGADQAPLEEYFARCGAWRFRPGLHYRSRHRLRSDRYPALLPPAGGEILRQLTDRARQPRPLLVVARQELGARPGPPGDRPLARWRRWRWLRNVTQFGRRHADRAPVRCQGFILCRLARRPGNWPAQSLS